VLVSGAPRWPVALFLNSKVGAYRLNGGLLLRVRQNLLHGRYHDFEQRLFRLLVVFVVFVVPGAFILLVVFVVFVVFVVPGAFILLRRRLLVVFVVSGAFILRRRLLVRERERERA